MLHYTDTRFLIQTDIQLKLLEVLLEVPKYILKDYSNKRQKLQNKPHSTAKTDEIRGPHLAGVALVNPAET